MKQNWVEKALQREFDFRIFDLICKGPLQKNYEKCKGFPTGMINIKTTDNPVGKTLHFL